MQSKREVQNIDKNRPSMGNSISTFRVKILLLADVVSSAGAAGSAGQADTVDKHRIQREIFFSLARSLQSLENAETAERNNNNRHRQNSS